MDNIVCGRRTVSKITQTLFKNCIFKKNEIFFVIWSWELRLQLQLQIMKNTIETI